MRDLDIPNCRMEIDMNASDSAFRFPSRVAAIREVIAGAGLDGILISNGENRRYLSGFIASAGFLLITSSETRLITDFRYTEQAAIQAPGFMVVRQSGRLSEWFPPILAELGICKLGIESDDMTVATLARFEEAVTGADVNIEFVPTTGHTVKLRAIKDSDELAALQRAIDVGDAAFEETLRKLRPGMMESEAAWEFEKSIRERGAESLSFDTIVASGPNAARPHHQTGTRELCEGETIVFDCGAKFEGYCSDLTRTVVLGEADAEVVRVYNIVLEAQELAIREVRAGMTGEAADGLARRVISEAGHGDDFGHSLGHGLGLEVHEDPHVGPRADDILEVGMPFTIEPGIYIPGWGGVRIEDVVVLEPDGARVLSHAHKARY